MDTRFYSRVDLKRVEEASKLHNLYNDIETLDTNNKKIILRYQKLSHSNLKEYLMTNVIDSDTHLLTVLCLKVSTWVIFMSDYVKIPKTQAMKYFLYSFVICLLFRRLQLLS